MVIYPSSFTFASVPVDSSAIAVAWPERSVASIQATNRSFRTGFSIVHCCSRQCFAIFDNVSSRRMEDRRRDRIGALKPAPGTNRTSQAGLRMSADQGGPEAPGGTQDPRLLPPAT